jgi:hypothetical protein
MFFLEVPAKWLHTNTWWTFLKMWDQMKQTNNSYILMHAFSQWQIKQSPIKALFFICGFAGWHLRDGESLVSKFSQECCNTKANQSKAYTLDAKPHHTHTLHSCKSLKFNLYSTSTTPPAHPIYGGQSIEVHSLGCWQSHKTFGTSILISCVCMVVG